MPVVVVLARSHLTSRIASSTYGLGVRDALPSFRAQFRAVCGRHLVHFGLPHIPIVIAHAVSKSLMLIADKWFESEAAANIMRRLGRTRQHDVIVLLEQVIAHALLQKVLLRGRFRQTFLKLVAGDEGLLDIWRMDRNFVRITSVSCYLVENLHFWSGILHASLCLALMLQHLLEQLKSFRLARLPVVHQ